MAGRKELGFPKTSACSLRELAAKTTLRNVRLQGHSYVDLREEKKKFIFYCTLCRATCYSDSSLFDHLKGNLHAQRYSAAKITLLGPNPFPFNDGVLFFHDSSEQDKPLATSGSNQDRFLNTDKNDDQLAVVSHTDKTLHNMGKNLNTVDDGSDKNVGSRELVVAGHDKSLNADSSENSLVIPGVVCDYQISDLEVKFVGFGEIGARIFEDGKSPNGSISSIWCAWLGKENPQDGIVVPDHDFGIVTFSYNHPLGRSEVSDDSPPPMLTTGPCAETQVIEGNNKKKRKKSFSDPEDISVSYSKKRVSFGNDRRNTEKPSLSSALVRRGEQLNENIVSNKPVRQEMRRQELLESDRFCDMCRQKILPGKDVSTLLNMDTGQLACSSRNKNGAFHVFHTSCLIHWILLCEYDMSTRQFNDPKITVACPKLKNGSLRKESAKQSEKHVDDLKVAPRMPLSSVFCPECQGTGIYVEDKLEDPTVNLSEIFKCKIAIIDGHKAWMKGPETLQNCSTGLRFSSQQDEPVQGNMKPLKLMYFYRADW